jgi:hypothetical protein
LGSERAVRQWYEPLRGSLAEIWSRCRSSRWGSRGGPALVSGRVPVANTVTGPDKAARPRNGCQFVVGTDTLRKSATGAQVSRRDGRVRDVCEASCLFKATRDLPVPRASNKTARIGAVWGEMLVWDIKVNDHTKQQNLIITDRGKPIITVDNIKVAQFFIYLLLNNKKFAMSLSASGGRACYCLVGSLAVGSPSWNDFGKSSASATFCRWSSISISQK